MSDLMVIEDLPLETLTELAKESFADCADALQVYLENEAKLNRFGRILKACKAKVAHGEWQNWVRETFAGHLSLRAVQLWIAEADDPERRQKRLEQDKAQKRKAAIPKAQDLALLPEPQPELQQPEPASEPLSQPCAPRDTRDPDDPPPLPKTNTHHTPASRQQIDRGDDQPAMPKLREGQVYIYRDGKLQEANAWDCAEGGFGEEELLDAMIESTNSAAIFARIMRRKATEIDPQGEAPKPKPEARAGKVPTAEQLWDATGAMVTDDPALLQAAHEWATYKQSLSADARVKSLQSWQTAVKRMVKVASERGSVHVCDLIERAIANGYVGWEHDYSNGKQQSKTEACRVRSGRNWGDLPVYDLDGGLVSGKPN